VLNFNSEKVNSADNSIGEDETRNALTKYTNTKDVSFHTTAFYNGKTQALFDSQEERRKAIECEAYSVLSICVVYLITGIPLASGNLTKEDLLKAAIISMRKADQENPALKKKLDDLKKLDDTQAGSSSRAVSSLSTTSRRGRSSNTSRRAKASNAGSRGSRGSRRSRARSKTMSTRDTPSDLSMRSAKERSITPIIDNPPQPSSNAPPSLQSEETIDLRVAVAQYSAKRVADKRDWLRWLTDERLRIEANSYFLERRVPQHFNLHDYFPGLRGNKAISIVPEVRLLRWTTMSDLVTF
jgi:hypothetical protein